ncbi:MAG: GNAT family N-acetyltransferase [Wenzhouxiangellaceae bacterium]
MAVEYRLNETLTAAAFVDLLRRSGLAARRPVDDVACIEQMLRHANLLISAWQGEKLVGVARSVTDFAYCCYLSDLAVDLELQRSGIGKQLIERTMAQLGPRCKLILLSAPAAVDYYPKLGFERHPQAWIKAVSDHPG